MRHGVEFQDELICDIGYEHQSCYWAPPQNLFYERELSISLFHWCGWLYQYVLDVVFLNVEGVLASMPAVSSFRA
jgi:hypothetical protein